MINKVAENVAHDRKIINKTKYYLCPRCKDIAPTHDLPRPPCSFANLREVKRCKVCGFENYNSAFKRVRN